MTLTSVAGLELLTENDERGYLERDEEPEIPLVTDGRHAAALHGVPASRLNV